MRSTEPIRIIGGAYDGALVKFENVEHVPDVITLHWGVGGEDDKTKLTMGKDCKQMYVLDMQEIHSDSGIPDMDLFYVTEESMDKRIQGLFGEL